MRGRRGERKKIGGNLERERRKNKRKKKRGLEGRMAEREERECKEK